MRRAVLFFLLVVAAGAAALAWYATQTTSGRDSALGAIVRRYLTGQENTGALLLYGNVEIRQVDLAFAVDGPIAAVRVDEGDRVKAGQVLALLDKTGFQAQFDQAVGSVAALEAQLAALIAGPRRQEIDQARAALVSAKATKTNADIAATRAQDLVRTQAGPQSNLDQALANKLAADANVSSAQAALDLRLEGTRPEDIAAARGNLAASRANLEYLRYRLTRAELTAPSDGIVLTRIREPGAVVMANSPVLTVSVIDPVWVRAYVDGPHLGEVVPGRAVAVTTDASPGKTYKGHVGFVSPTAEFTPRAVETPELRTSLVYRVRVIVENPDDALRQGMPATIRLVDRAPDRSQ